MGAVYLMLYPLALSRQGIVKFLMSSVTWRFLSLSGYSAPESAAR